MGVEGRKPRGKGKKKPERETLFQRKGTRRSLGQGRKELRDGLLKGGEKK